LPVVVKATGVVVVKINTSKCAPDTGGVTVAIATVPLIKLMKVDGATVAAEAIVTGFGCKPLCTVEIFWKSTSGIFYTPELMYHLPAVLFQTNQTARFWAIAMPTRMLPEVPNVTAPSTGISTTIIPLPIKGDRIVWMVVEPVIRTISVETLIVVADATTDSLNLLCTPGIILHLHLMIPPY
jgi:hypothetical protein